MFCIITIIKFDILQLIFYEKTEASGGFMKKFTILLICLVFLGCSHEVTVKPTVSPIAYQLIDHKVNGNIAIFVHPDLADLNLVVKPRGRSCSIVKFPIDAGPSIKGSLIKTARSIFENSTVVDSVSQDHGFDGILAAELLDFDVDVKFNDGLWGGTAESWVEMNIKLTFYDANLNPVWRTVVGYTKKDFSAAGGACGGGATAISGGMEQCLNKISIQMVEKIIDSSMITTTIARAGRS